MTKYRSNLPQLSGDLFLTDGGLETTLIFHDGFDLPCFASFCLLKDVEGRSAIERYLSTYAAIAKASNTGFIFESPTWRASTDWGARLGYSDEDLAEANRASIDMLLALRDVYETDSAPMVISGNIGPRGDGYILGEGMSEDDAQAYHAAQVDVFSQTEADMIGALTMTSAEEAIGLTRASMAAGMPASISFTVETDGRLPSGQPLGEAIEAVDEATARGPAYFMVNCAHPTHFMDALAAGGPWTQRFRGIRANASALSHAELNEAEELDAGDPAELGRQYAEMRRELVNLNVLGGCCGTDHRHIEEMRKACAPGA